MCLQAFIFIYLFELEGNHKTYYTHHPLPPRKKTQKKRKKIKIKQNKNLEWEKT